MANKQLNARFQQKHDTEANWNKVGTTFTPLKGEVIVYDVDSAHSVPRFKIGDGSTKLSSLPFYQSGVQKVTGGTANGTINVDDTTIKIPGITDIATGSSDGTISKTIYADLNAFSTTSDVEVKGWSDLNKKAGEALDTAQLAMEENQGLSSRIIPLEQAITGSHPYIQSQSGYYILFETDETGYFTGKGESLDSLEISYDQEAGDILIVTPNGVDCMKAAAMAHVHCTGAFNDGKQLTFVCDKIREDSYAGDILGGLNFSVDVVVLKAGKVIPI